MHRAPILPPRHALDLAGDGGGVIALPVRRTIFFDVASDICQRQPLRLRWGSTILLIWPIPGADQKGVGKVWPNWAFQASYTLRPHYNRLHCAWVMPSTKKARWGPDRD
jgi:hypothetical protein